MASNLINIHKRFSIPGLSDQGFFLKRPGLRVAHEKRSYHSQAVERRLKEIAQSTGAAWWCDSFQYCYPNTLDERVFYTTRANLPFAYISANDGYMHLDDSTVQALLYIDLISFDKGIENLIAGIINCQMFHIKENNYRSAFFIPEGKCIYADRARNSTDSNPDSNSDFVYETRQSIKQDYKIWDQSILCSPVRLLYAYYKSGADMNLLTSDWPAVLKLSIGQFDDPRYKYEDLLFPVTCIEYSPVIYSSRELQSVRIYANIQITSNLTKSAELLNTQNSLRDLSERCHALKSEISTAINARGSVNHSTFGTIYASEIDRFGNAVCMENIDLHSLIGLPFTDAAHFKNSVYLQTRKFCLSPQNVLYQSTDKACSSLFLSDAVLTTALTTLDPGELHTQLKKIKKIVADSGINPDFNGKTAKKAIFNQNTLFAELISHLLRINPRLLA